MSFDKKIEELKIELPPPIKQSIGMYVPALRVGNQIWVSGQIPRKVDGTLLCTGKLGREIDIEKGKEAARLCVLNALANIKEALGGSLDKVVRIIKVTGFVASNEGFNSQPQVINGASEVLHEVFGVNGHHARSAVGVFELPLGVPVEVELVLEVRD